MKLKISHLTTYEFDNPVNHGFQQIRLNPPSMESQTVLDWNLSIEGGIKEMDFTDQNNNLVTLTSLDPGITTCKITCEGTVNTKDKSGIVKRHRGYTQPWYFKQPTALTQPGEHIHNFVKSLPNHKSSKDDIAYLHQLSKAVENTVSYQKGETCTTTSAEDAMQMGKGVCQDHVHIFISAVRLLGFPARYVSGYIFMEDRTKQDAGHAWAEVWVNNLGWVGFDVSNKTSPNDKHVRIATGLDYADAAPVHGIRFGNGKEKISVSLRIEQI